MKKVLIANRGEIAVRIIRACHELGLKTVAVYSQADKQAMHVAIADEAICVGSALAKDSYLKIPHILAACEVTGADSLHPGYGFLSENSHFASICESSQINFIGPSSQSIAALGNKANAKALAQLAGVATIPGSAGILLYLEEGLECARTIGFPLVIKAVAGGGGKGIRIVYEAKDFEKMFLAAQSEAQASFNDPGIYLEKLIVKPRHIEIQIAADKHGHYVHLGERDCTLQRRRQKLIEESPSPIMTPKLRDLMGEAAIKIAQAARYHSVGTIEFLLDEHKNFYFMEMNTRIQVEHTVTEEWTGVDLVRLQLAIARGEKLPFKQKDVEFRGHVIQCRINAEDPLHQFAPSPGKLEYYVPSGGPHVRVDSACYAGYFIPPYYDSMIAKLITKGIDRTDAIAIMQRALKEFHIGGIHSTIAFHQYMLQQPEFKKALYDIQYVDRLMEQDDFTKNFS